MTSPIAGEPLRVLFVCTANICRSPLMEIEARRLAGDADIVFTSAGTHGLRAAPMDADMATVLPAGAAEAFRSRPIDTAILEQADLVLTAETSHRAFILEEHAHLHRKVFTLGQFVDTIAGLPDLHGRELVAAAGRRRTPPRADGDIADPYRRGTAAVEQAAGTVSSMLSVVVPRLVGDRCCSSSSRSPSSLSFWPGFSSASWSASPAWAAAP